MIFVDSGAWFALTVPADKDHHAATRWMSTNAADLLTTDYIVDETLTLLKARGQAPRAQTMGEQFFSGVLTRIHYLTQEEIDAAWQVFRTYSDKDWSFTDCASKVVIEKLDITHAFAFDQHFRQFGSVIVVP